jgi:hypothetical protein
MRTPVARSRRPHPFVVAALLLSALGGCEREAPTGLTLEPGPVVGTIFIGPPSASGQVAVVGQPVTIDLEVVDHIGRAVSGVPISWAVVHDGGSTDVASSTTDTSGTAKVMWTLDTTAKLDSLWASIASGGAMLVTATGRHAAAVPAIIVSGDSQTVTAGTASQPFVVRLTDRYGNPIAHSAVAWAVIGGGTLSAITTTTDTTGTTQVTLSTDPNAPGLHRIIATYGVVPATTFTLTSTSQ